MYEFPGLGGCGHGEYPGVYTNVHHYNHWIRQVLINASPGFGISHILMLTTVAVILFTRTAF